MIFKSAFDLWHGASLLVFFGRWVSFEISWVLQIGERERDRDRAGDIFLSERVEAVESSVMTEL